MSSMTALALGIVLTISVVPPTEARKYSYDEVRHGINIYYGNVVSIERAETNNARLKGAMIGGIAGFAYGSHRDHHRTKDTVAGALAGALIGAMIDAHQKHTFAYRVRLGDGHQMEVVSEHSEGIREGDCVQIEDGRRVNVRRVSPSYCEEEIDEFDLHDARHQASQCDRAKELLLEVETADELKLVQRKVRRACG